MSMEITTWWCPECHSQTGNWTTCRQCGKQAVRQRFKLVPIVGTEEALKVTGSKRTVVKLNYQQSASTINPKAMDLCT
jgi:hypothetical protein